MKPFLTFLSIILLSFTHSAQTVQHGIVKEYNEKDQKTPLAGVELKIRSANSTVSDKSGKFSLEFLTLKPGERVNVRAIEKLGYEIFNKEAIEQWNINPKEPFTVIMCRSDRFKKIRDNYEKVASASYARQLEKEKAEIARLKKEGKLKEIEYNQKLIEIQDNYYRQLDNLDNYIDRFSRIDLSEISATEQEIIELVQQGKVDEAIQRYDDLDIIGNLKHDIQDRNLIQQAKEKLSELEQLTTESVDNWYAIAERHIETLLLQGQSSNNQKIADIYREIATADTTNVEWLLKSGGFFKDYLADYKKSNEYYEMALRNALIQFGPQHSFVAVSCNNLGTVYLSLGEFDRALDYFVESLEIRILNYGTSHPDVATAYSNIASVYSSLGEYAKALEYYEMANAIWEGELPPNDPILALSYNNIGYIYSMLGVHSKELDYLKKALDIRLKAYGSKHIDVAFSYSNLGSAYLDLKDFEKALDNYEMALEIRKSLLGHNHPDVAICYNNLGAVYSDLGDFDLSLDYYQKAHDIKVKVWGPDHPDVGMSYNNLGTVYASTGDHVLAFECYAKALMSLENFYGEHHPYIATLYGNIGYECKAIKDYENALAYQTKALEMRKTIFGELDYHIASSCCDLGITHIELGNLDIARQFLKDALDILERTVGVDHPDDSSIANVRTLLESL